MKIFSVLAVCAYCVAAEKIKIGDLKNLHHGVSGSVFATDDHTLVIENFNYDGAGLKSGYHKRNSLSIFHSRSRCFLLGWNRGKSQQCC